MLAPVKKFVDDVQRLVAKDALADALRMLQKLLQETNLQDFKNAPSQTNFYHYQPLC